jgi:hypothetical protein
VFRWRSLELVFSLVQRNHTECDVSVCDHKALIMRRPWPTGGGGEMGLNEEYCLLDIVLILAGLDNVPPQN